MTTTYYVAQEKAMAPGIVKDWPEIILLPKNKNGRLKKVDEKLCLIIAEAFNVYTETSLTPRQLNDQRRELLESLIQMYNALDYYTPVMGFTSAVKEALKNAKNLIAKTKGEI